MAHATSCLRRVAVLILFVTACLGATGCSHTDDIAQASSSDHTAPAGGIADVNVPAGSFTIAETPTWVKEIKTPAKGVVAPIYAPLLDTQYRFDGEGNVQGYTRFVVAGTDIAALQKQGQQSIQFDPRFQKVVLHAVRIWRDGQRIDVTDSVKPRFLTDDRARNTVFAGKVNTLIQVPGFRAGDHLELAWTTKGTNPLFRGFPWKLEDWNMPFPIWRRHAAYLAPEKAPLRVSLLPHTSGAESRAGRLKRTDKTRDGWVSIEYSDNNLPALSFQPQAAQGSLQSDLLIATSFRDWDAVSAWAAKLFDEVEKPKGDDYRKLVEELGKYPSPAERIAAALQWGQREIRYVSLSIGENSHRPYPPDEVLARRYGDCKDTALLLVNLLRSLGIEAQPALMNTLNSRLVRRLDAIPWFNHAIALVWLDGQVYALDGTARGQKSRLEHLAALHGGNDVFVVGGDSPGFLRIPFPGSIEDRTVRYEAHMVVAPETHAGTLTSLLVVRGAAAERTRNELAAKQRSEFKRNMLSDMQRLHANAKWSEEPEVTDDPEINEISIRSVFLIPRPLKRSGRNWRNEYDNDYVLNRLPKIGNADRKIPVALDLGTQRALLTYTFDVRATYRIEEEAHEETIVSPAFSATIRRLRPSATRLIDMQELTLLNDSVEWGDIPAYQQAAQDLTDFRPEIRVSRTPPSASRETH